ncbi:efflux RND transporter permease subunit [Fibrella aquatilis]|uniref:Efflux RND transporter permease subunit n=1 Tax=Fibrella aquatilis TaxID=2817059 RepID=A0A939GAV8_9BACT|nr:efflux RND transporter permease subunit [Fibrella aquatilis]MBO0932988.1 efflux RND transporter permease subunit [Fibrella aquatilis]
MNIIKFSVKNYQFTLIVFLAVLSIGLYALFTMPRGEDPEFESPQYLVTVIYPGATPEDIEELIINPLEQRINGLSALKRTASASVEGAGVCQVEFSYSEDPDAKYQEVMREVNALATVWPSDIMDVRVQKIRPHDVNIYQFALVSNSLSYAKLQAHAEALRNQLRKVGSLADVSIWGLPTRQVSVRLNTGKMAQERVSVNQVLGALQAENINLPGGSVDLLTKRFSVKTTGGYKHPDEIKNTIVYSDGRRVVHLKDIADVRIDYAPRTHQTALNGHRCVFVTACQKPGQNITAVGHQVTPLFAAFKAKLPPTVDAVNVFDQARSVDKRLGRFATDFGLAILLVLITLIPLGFRASLVVMVSIPLSLAIGLAILYAAGFTINQLSIVGMIVALGILVDDSIVVVENIQRQLRGGQSRQQAAIDATRQIAPAVVGCTVLLCLAFLPIANLPEAAGAFIRNLPVAVMATVGASMLVSLTIVPFLASVVLAKTHHAEGNMVLRALNRLIHATYGRSVDWCLTHAKLTLVMAMLVFGSVLWVAIDALPMSLFPSSEKPMFLVNVKTPTGSNLAVTERIVKQVEQVVLRHPDIQNVATNIGRDNPRVYYNLLQGAEAANTGQLLVMLNDMDTKHKKAMIDQLRAQLGQVANARVEVKDFEQGPPLSAPINYNLFGDNLDTLRRAAQLVEQTLKRNPATIYVENPLNFQPTDLKVSVNKEKAGLLNISIADINRAIRLGVAGLTIGSFKGEDSQHPYPINVSAGTNAPTDFDFFDQLYVNNALGTAIPLRQVADLHLSPSQTQIYHNNRDRFATVSSFVRSGYTASVVNRELVQALKSLRLPEGVTLKVAGEAESVDSSFGGIGVIVLVTLFGMIAVLVLEFGSLKSTLIVLSVVPLGMVGAIAALMLAHETLSFTAVVGFLALIGIEVKNSLLLVDHTNRLREAGWELTAAIRRAGEVRFVPILLTSLTAIGGLLPLIIEYSDLYSPLALVLVGGIISSTLLARLVTPVLYQLMPPAIALPAQNAPADPAASFIHEDEEWAVPA